jgi:YfiH family protein
MTGRDEDCADLWTLLAATAEAAPDRLVRPSQVHGSEVLCINEAAGAYVRPLHGDALVSNRDDVVLTIRVADCVPLLVVDQKTGVIAAVHAGWRGTMRRIATQAVAAVHETFGSRPADLIVAVGPSIGPCCYRVGSDVERAFTEGGWSTRDRASCFVNHDGDVRLDLWAANRQMLVHAGVPHAAIHIARLCTVCHPNLFYSYRRDGPGTGRMIAFIRRGVGKMKNEK